jgi:hypothetical protein
MSDGLSNKQFSVERNLIGQGNMDELRTRVGGFQNLTSNIYKPSFAADYTTVRGAQSPAAAGGGQEEEEE